MNSQSIFDGLARNLVKDCNFKRMQAGIRTYDTIGRYGGEEFLILLPGCNRSETADEAERLCKTMFQQPIQTESGPLKITMSVGGVASVDWPEYTASQMLHLADSALYRAKQEGRNRTVIVGATEQEEALRPSLELSSFGPKER